jgi:imidazolonepropionase-like amidohydrolase
MIKQLSSTLALLLLSYSVQVSADTVVIHAGELLAVPGTKTLSQQSIIIVDGKITEVRAGFVNSQEISKDASLIDLSDSFVMPGLMDMHVHLQTELGPDSVRDRLKMSDERDAQH